MDSGRLADVVLVVHVLVVAFVVLGLALTFVGGWRGWDWTRHGTFRVLHLATVVFIAAQAWAGQWCPLTTWEQALRRRAGQATQDTGFIEHWLARLLYIEAPWWAFVVAYTLLAVLVAWAWWRWPPRWRRRAP